MNPINSAKNAILKPEFVFRPGQLWRRLNWKRQWQDNHGQVTLPWGLALEIDASETIGMAITKIGVYDLVVPEAIFRLCDPCETALDVGANIGMNTGALALATGPTGKVVAYEPHPKLLQGLEETIASWKRSFGINNVDLRPQAVSDRAGTAALSIPSGFEQNLGTATLAAPEATTADGAATETLDVPVVTLDDEFPNEDDRVGVMKIDIEGHESAALRGAERLLGVGCIRDIIFEEHTPLPSDVSRLLEGHGYEIFLLRKDTLGPRIIPTPCELPEALPNYLATLDPERAQKRFKKRGYRSLRTHPLLRTKR
ncbi:MAG: FkbM family methyltransferase [Verrucomicrobiales bacterium]